MVSFLRIPQSPPRGAISLVTVLYSQSPPSPYPGPLLPENDYIERDKDKSVLRLPVTHFTGVLLGQASEVCTSKAPGALWATLKEPTILSSHQIQAVGKSSSPLLQSQKAKKEIRKGSFSGSHLDENSEALKFHIPS